MRSILKSSVLLLLVGCSTDHTPTVGDQFDRMSLSFCDAVDRCGNAGHIDVAYCSEHAVYHLCHQFDCGEDVSKEEVSSMDQCISALDKLNAGDFWCFPLAHFGVLPDECEPFFGGLE